MARKTENLIRLPQEVKDMLVKLAYKKNLSQSVLVEKLIRQENQETFGE